MGVGRLIDVLAPPLQPLPKVFVRRDALDHPEPRTSLSRDFACRLPILKAQK
jgi:hypothetical protein